MKLIRINNISIMDETPKRDRTESGMSVEVFQAESLISGGSTSPKEKKEAQGKLKEKSRGEENNAGGRLKVWNNRILVEMQNEIKGEITQARQDRARSRETMRRARSESSLSGARASPEGADASPELREKMLKKNSKYEDLAAELKKQRELDQQMIKERVIRDAERRDLYFESAKTEMETQQNVSDVISMIRRHTQRERRKLVAKHMIFTEKYKKTLQHAHRYLMGDVDRWKQGFAEEGGTDGVDGEDELFPEGEEGMPKPHGPPGGQHYLPSISPSPVRVSFRKGSEIFAPVPERPSPSMRSSASDGDLLDRFCIRPPAVWGLPKSRSRPTFDATGWSQEVFAASPLGHAAKIRDSQVAGVQWSAMKCGAGEVFVPNEQDGVNTAGKRRTKYARNDLGVLRGDLVRRGDAAQYKTLVGGGSAAPCQDHFDFPRGNEATDEEFPKGKKVFEHVYKPFNRK